MDIPIRMAKPHKTVFAIMRKREAAKIREQFQDLVQFPEQIKKTKLTKKLVVLAEHQEIANDLLN